MMICVVYSSRYGKNQHCARLLTTNFRAAGQETNLYSVGEVRPRSLPDARFYVFWAPPGFTGRPPQTIVRFARVLGRTRVSPRYAVASVRRAGSASMSPRLAQILEGAGFEKHGPRLDLDAEKSGTIEAGYEERLAAFADDCIRSRS